MEVIESTLIQTKEDLEFAFANNYYIVVDDLDIIFKTKESIKTYASLMGIAECEGCLRYVDYEVERIVNFCY